jgi:hypothetical protein
MLSAFASPAIIACLWRGHSPYIPRPLCRVLAERSPTHTARAASPLGTATT